MLSDSETCKILKAAHAIQLITVITFLSMILNQLFLLVTSDQEDGLYVIRALRRFINMLRQAEHKYVLQAYIKIESDAFSK